MKASIAVTALFLSVAVTAVSAQNGAPPRVPGIDTLGMDRSVRPQDDFYRFVNGAWDDKMAIPADRSYYGSLVEVGERAQEPVRGILEAEATKPQAPESIGQKVGGFYERFNDEAAIERRGIQPIASELAAISRLASVRGLSLAFLRASQRGVRTPLSIRVAQDPQRSDVYAVIVTQAGLGMPDRDEDLRPDQQFAAVRAADVEYISRLLTLAAQPDPAGAASRIVSLAKTLAEHQWDRTRNRDRSSRKPHRRGRQAAGLPEDPRRSADRGAAADLEGLSDLRHECGVRGLSARGVRRCAEPESPRGFRGRHRRPRVDVAGHEGPGPGEAREVLPEDRVPLSVAAGRTLCPVPSTSGAEPDVSPLREQDEAVGAAAATHEILRSRVTHNDV